MKTSIFDRIAPARPSRENKAYGVRWDPVGRRLEKSGSAPPKRDARAWKTCVSAESNAHCRSLYQAPPLRRPPLVAVYSGPGPTAVATQFFAVVMREASRLKRLECSTRRQSSTRVREFREWKRTKASLLCSEHDAHLITGDNHFVKTKGC